MAARRCADGFRSSLSAVGLQRAFGVICLRKALLGGHPSNSKHRTLATPSKRGKRPHRRKNGDERSPVEQHAAMSWAQRLKRVFNIDIAVCKGCGGTVKVIASIEDPGVIKQILVHLERKAESKQFNPLPESRAPPQKGLFG